jgi:hypothetical protein
VIDFPHGQEETCSEQVSSKESHRSEEDKPREEANSAQKAAER